MAQPSGTATLTTNLGEDTFHFVNPAQINQAWGSIASQLGGLGVMGEHSSAAGVFTPDPGEGGRQGVGNVSKDDPRFLPDDAEAGTGDALAHGAQGYHAIFQAARLGDPALPDGSVEEAVGPLFPELHGSVSVDLII